MVVRTGQIEVVGIFLVCIWVGKHRFGSLGLISSTTDNCEWREDYGEIGVSHGQ